MNALSKQILEELDQLSETATYIPKEKKYWLIRTKGGEYYDSFKDFNYIGIDYPKISADVLKQLDIKNANIDIFYMALRHLVAEQYNKVKHIGLAANQIYSFVREIKKGDTVIIPSGNSDVISFGKVLYDSFYVAEKGEVNLTSCPFIKRRKVEWFEQMKRSKVDPYFAKVFQSHHAINDVTQYKDYIERSTSGFYKFEDQSHLITNIHQHEALDAEAVFGFGYELLMMAKELSLQYDLDLDFYDVKVKVLLNSEGKFEWITRHIRTATFLGVLTVFITGGGLQAGEDFEINTPGLIQSISEFLDARAERKQRQVLLEKYADSIKVAEPEEFINVMKQFDENKDLPE